MNRTDRIQLMILDQEMSPAIKNTRKRVCIKLVSFSPIGLQSSKIVVALLNISIGSCYNF